MPPKIEPNKPVPNEIKSYFHCRECIKELPFGESPMSYARYSVGASEPRTQAFRSGATGTN